MVTLSLAVRKNPVPNTSFFLTLLFWGRLIRQEAVVQGERALDLESESQVQVLSGLPPLLYDLGAEAQHN